MQRKTGFSRAECEGEFVSRYSLCKSLKDFIWVMEIIFKEFKVFPNHEIIYMSKNEHNRTKIPIIVNSPIQIAGFQPSAKHSAKTSQNLYLLWFTAYIYMCVCERESFVVVYFILSSIASCLGDYVIRFFPWCTSYFSFYVNQCVYIYIYIFNIASF